MEHIIFTVFLFVGFSFVLAQEDNNLGCCSPGFYLLKSTECWNPTTDVTTNKTLPCNNTVKVSNFTVKDNKLVIKISDLYTETFDSDIGCYWNMTKDKNLTKIKKVALLCITDTSKEIKAARNLSYCMIVSIIFLGITAIIYMTFEKLRDLFGKSVINLCVSLAIGETILAIINLMSYSDMTACAIRGFLTYFFILVAFFWTNSISIQVLRDSRRPCISVDYGWSEFKWYALYSWGVPSILTIIMAVVNFHPGDHDRPGIGLNHCWFLTKKQQWYYMYSVMSVLLVVNIAIFLYMAKMVWRYSFQSSHMKALRFKLSMTIRLIVLMGIPWIFEMVSSAVGGGSLIWDIVDGFNSLQGILVFLVLVVFRKKVLKQMNKRGWCDCCSGLVDWYLALGEDVEENVIQHTDVPMSEDHTNGYVK